MFLDAVADAHTEQSSGADSIDALAGLPLHTRRVRGGQAPHAAQAARGVALARGKVLHVGNGARHGTHTSQRPPPHGGAVAGNHGNKNQAQKHHGRVVRFHFQQHENRHQRQRGFEQTVPQRLFLIVVAVEHIGSPEHDRKFCQLRRLQRERTARKVDPAVGTVGVHRAEQRRHQQHERDDVKTLVHVAQGTVVDVGHQPHNAQARHCNDALRADEVVDITVVGVPAGIAG